MIFLGKERPEVPFLKVNEGDAVTFKYETFSSKCVASILRNVSMASGAIVVACFAVY